MKRTKASLASLTAIMVLALVACGSADERSPDASGQVSSPLPDEQGPRRTLQITSPSEGEVVPGNVVSLRLEGTGVDIVPADGDASGATGHYHVFIDRDPVPAGAPIPREAGIVHSTDNPVVLTGLGVGRHRLIAVYGDGTHARIGDTQAETTVEVAGPSVDASAPATTPAGSPVMLTVEVEGLSLVQGESVTGGPVAHLHVFIDRPPTPAGQPIPFEAGIIHRAETTIPVPDLAPGEHTLWVVAGDATHTPLDPPVMDKVTVVVD